jgi:peptidoglycan/LPS O-acetylase OafA/YrhL
MGYLPALDGVRAVAVLAVVGYHLGWGWLSGGFLGVEVFFVVSGYLITSLLLGEHQRNGSVALGPFWLRRARRLLPALGAMVAGVTIWALLFSEATAAVLRRDLVPSLVYVANWWQIFGVEAPYFTPADPPLLRHLWSLAVEEQWYVLWPLVFPWLWTRSGRRRGKVAAVLLAVAVALMAFTAVASWGADANRLNFLYLSTPTRATGLLVGAAAAMVWRPWQGRHHRVPTRVLEVAGWGAVSVLGVAMVTLTVSGMALYRGGLAVVTLASVVLIAAVVHPASGRLGRVLGHPWLVAVGRRSYGLYLWHWPIIVFSDARSGGWVAVVTAVVVTVVVTELSYRYVETPVRRGALGAWWTSVRATPLMAQRTRVAVGSAVGVSSVFLVSTVVLGLSRVAVVDPSVDPRDDVVWTAPVAAAPVTTVVNSIPGPSVTSTVAVVVPEQPVRLVVVGDSQAGSLVRNLPEGLDMLFEVSDGSINGCGVYDRGVAVSARQGLRHDFAECADWPVRWADAARQSQAQVALMMIGAWEVLDMEWESTSLPVGAPRTDVHFLREAQRGVNALVEAGAHVAVLEVACMRPLDAPGAGVPALPERGDDRRVAHLNTLLRLLVERNPGTTTFLAGPVEWCSGSPKSVDPAYRWDGVHVYKPGVALIFDTIAGHVLSLAARS